MKQVLAKGRHPKNNRVRVWMDEDDKTVLKQAWGSATCIGENKIGGRFKIMFVTTTCFVLNVMSGVRTCCVVSTIRFVVSELRPGEEA